MIKSCAVALIDLLPGELLLIVTDCYSMNDTSSNNKLKINSLRRLWNAFVYSIKGLRSTWSSEQAFRQEALAAIILIPIAVVLPVSLLTKFVLVASVFAVLIVELLNSAIEAVVDLATEDHHPLAEKAKDAASAAVFLSLVFLLGLWTGVLYSCFA